MNFTIYVAHWLFHVYTTLVWYATYVQLPPSSGVMHVSHLQVGHIHSVTHVQKTFVPSMFEQHLVGRTCEGVISLATFVQLCM